MPIAIKTEEPKYQHYEVPTAFFKLVLGKHLKYRQKFPTKSKHIVMRWSRFLNVADSLCSCCFFPDKSSTLEDAEKAMLELYCERSQIEDGHSVLDVGCGWGSLSLYLAQKYPNCQITGICNSATQKAHIEEQCRYWLCFLIVNLWFRREISRFNDTRSSEQGTWTAKRGDHCCRYQYIWNGGFLWQSILHWNVWGTKSEPDLHYKFVRIAADRAWSSFLALEQHMKNYRDLLKKISGWMKPDSLLFVHYFCHKAFAYHFEVTAAWTQGEPRFISSVNTRPAHLLM